MNTTQNIEYINRKAVLPWWEHAIHILILVSISLFILEVGFYNTESSLTSPIAFLWAERIIATCFTVEYIYRMFYHRGGWKYILSWMGFLDALSIIPFWIGFAVHGKALHIIRAFRVLRLFKLYRYSLTMQSMARGLFAEWRSLRAIGKVVFAVLLFFGTIIFEVERLAQPDKFSSLWDGIWFSVVTITTVGYGDLYPVTPLGRCVTALLMIIGVGIVGALFSTIGNAINYDKNQEINATVKPKAKRRKKLKIDA